MARLAKLNHAKKLTKMQARYAKKRSALVEALRQDPMNEELRNKLQKLPRNASPVRRQTRCGVCGRTHSVFKKFKLCRICLRLFAMRGEVPGLVKASW